MRKFLALLLICTTTFAFAQKDMRIEYDEMHNPSPGFNFNHIGILFITKGESYYQTLFMKRLNSGAKSTNTLYVESSNNIRFSEVYINQSQKKLYENLYEERALNTYFSATEDIPKLKWQLVNETKKVNNYVCKKATTQFRGRTYTAWYTEQIPVSKGPWKFGGLPGLILSVEDAEGKFGYFVKKISFDYKGENQLTQVKERLNKFKNVSFQELDKLIIDAKKKEFETRLAKARSKNMTGGFIYTTESWKEPVNEYRKEAKFQF